MSMLARFATLSRPSSVELISSSFTQNTASGTSLVISRPASVQAGDLLLSLVYSNAAAASAVTWTGDTGWTEAADSAGISAMRVAYKTATASEAASYTFTSSASAINSGWILCYRNADFDKIGSFASLGAGGGSVTGITVATNGGPLLAFATVRNETGITFSNSQGMSVILADSDATTASAAVLSQAVTSGASGTRTITNSGTGTGGAVLLALKLK